MSIKYKRVTVGPFRNWARKNLPCALKSYPCRYSRAHLARMQRDYLLSLYGFSSYGVYLRSPIWSEVRSHFLGRPCYVCAGEAAQVHHVTYTEANLFGTDRTGMVPICASCHLLIEYDDQGRKRFLLSVNRVMRSLRKQHRAAPAIIPLLTKRQDRVQSQRELFFPGWSLFG